MSLVLAGLAIAGTSGVLVVGRWLTRRRSQKESVVDDAKGVADDAKRGDTPEDAAADEARSRAGVEDDAPGPKKPGSTAAPAAHVHLEGFACQLGDVLMRMTGEEAWLAGGLVLSEEALPVAVLFVAPDAVHDCAIYVRRRPRESLFWLEPLEPNTILVGGEPPSVVEHRSVRFERARRLPLRSRRIGVGAPDVGDAVVVAEYVSAGAERLVVLKGNTGLVRAYRGVELDQASFEVIASGRSTLE